jgi:hypothetical protein
LAEALGWIEGNLFYRGSLSGGLGLFPWSQVLKNFFNDIRLVNEADDAHLSLAFVTGKGVCFINFSDEVGPALLKFLG